MLQKALTLLALFVFFMSVNVVFAKKLIVRHEKDKKIAVILEEFSGVVMAAEPSKGGNKNVLGAETPVVDSRVATLKNFLRKHDSPLYDHAEFIIQTSDKYGLDVRLIPAIAMQESNVCKVIPPGSHNCWGWGIYGGKVTRFESYPEAIETVAKGLKLNYIDKGLTTPDDIMRKYNPSSNGSWAHGVNTFLNVLEE